MMREDCPEGARVRVRNLAGEHEAVVSDASAPGVRAGDLVEIDPLAKTARVLTPARRSPGWTRRILDPRRLHAMSIRTQVEAGIRSYFSERDFIETHTPLLVPCPGMEPHIRPFRVIPASTDPEAGGTDRSGYLPTSPEFAMKRLLVGGLERIFQLSPAFRDEPRSVTHRPEFTILEWYRAYAGYEEIMTDTEELVERLARQIHGEPWIPYQGRRISVARPWPRLRVRDLFLEHAGINLVDCARAEDLARESERLGLGAGLEREDWDDLYFRIWLNRIEPALPAEQAVFVTRYPASQAALAVVDPDPDGSRWARRFELYLGGLELGNAFEELTDPVEQRRRFVEDMELRSRVYGPGFPRSPLDEGFLEALEEGMPPSGGIAVGVDRLVMLLADEMDISYTFWI